MPRRNIEVEQHRPIRQLEDIILELHRFQYATNIYSEVRETASGMLTQIEAITNGSIDTLDAFTDQFEKLVYQKEIYFFGIEKDQLQQECDVDGFVFIEPLRSIQKQIAFFDEAKIGDRSFMRLIADTLFALGQRYPRNACDPSGQLISPLSGAILPPTHHFVCLHRYHYDPSELRLGYRSRPSLPHRPDELATLLRSMQLDENDDFGKRLARPLCDLELEQLHTILELKRCEEPPRRQTTMSFTQLAAESFCWYEEDESGSVTQPSVSIKVIEVRKKRARID